MIAAQVPELADGGYWYVVPAISEVNDPPGWNFGDWPVGACTWYAEIGGIMLCAVRTTTPVVGIEQASTAVVSDIVGGSSKPYARIGGF